MSDVTVSVQYASQLLYFYFAFQAGINQDLAVISTFPASPCYYWPAKPGLGDRFLSIARRHSPSE